MSVRDFRPFEPIGKFIANLLNLSKKQKKLMAVSSELLMVNIVVGLIFFYPHAIWILVVACLWASWRFVIRLLLFGYNYCPRCRRIKPKSDFSSPIENDACDCAQCEEKVRAIKGKFDGMMKALDSVSEAIQSKDQEIKTLSKIDPKL